MTIDLREAAVTAVLAGAVVVVLGYASGLGLHTPVVRASVVTPPQAPVTVQAVPPAVASTPVLPGTVFVAVPAAPAPVPAEHHVAHPSDPAPTTPTPTPEPVAPDCAPGLLTGLLRPVTGSLLGGVLSAVTDPVTCAVDGLLGGTCCPADGGSVLRTGGAR